MLSKWPRSSLALIGRRLVSSFKLEDFQDCRSYLKAVVIDGQLKQRTLQWGQISASLVNTLKMDENTRTQVKPKTLDYFVLATLSSIYDPHQTANYFRHLTEQGQDVSKVSLTAIIQAFKCWSRCELYKGDKDVIKQVVEDTLKRKRCSSEVKHVACAVLANLGNIDEGMSIWQEMFETTQYDTTNATSIMMAAIREDRLDVFWKLCENEHFLIDCVGSQVRSNNRARCDEVFEAFIEKYHENPEEMEKLFSYFRDRVYFLSLHLVYVIKDKYKNAYVTLKTKRNKNEMVPLHSVTKGDCQELADAFEALALSEDKIFKFSSPEEVERFNRVMDKLSKENINCVIDGLNAGLGGHIKHGRLDGRQGKEEHWIKALSWLRSHDYNILVIHRHWFKKRPEFNTIRDNVSAIHLLDKLSDDDIFSLLAALRFGPDTLLCSNDLYRNYYDKLPTPRLKRLFVNWQLHHKTRFWFAETTRRKNNVSFSVSQ